MPERHDTLTYSLTINMNIKQGLKPESLPILLINLMVMTRFHHFGDVLHLPEASLAVFFFAGFYRKKALLGFLLGLAALIDFIAIKNGTSGWCVTPAYVFLIPTYVTLWFAGRIAARFNTGKVSDLVKSLGLLMLSASMAFVISNASFYAFSGKFDALAMADYVAEIQQYFMPYVGSTLVYGIVGWAVVKLFKALPAFLSNRKAV